MVRGEPISKDHHQLWNVCPTAIGSKILKSDPNSFVCVSPALCELTESRCNGRRNLALAARQSSHKLGVRIELNHTEMHRVFIDREIVHQRSCELQELLPIHLGNRF
jgi:hypothetical protein